MAVLDPIYATPLAVRIIPNVDPNLAEHLKLKLSMRTDRKVFVTPELEVAHGQVIAALEAVQEAGGTPALVQVVDPEPR